jgi:tetrapyrrole methylase family protein/MazG family protein
MIFLIGLGPGDPQRLPAYNVDLLTSGLPVYLRTARHPVLASPALASLTFTAFDEVYETSSSFDETYDSIVTRVLSAVAEAPQGKIVYAVPGHPLIGETTVSRLITTAREQEIPFKVVGAPSFIDACLEAIGAAITDDLHIVDALTLNPNAPMPPDSLQSAAPLLLYQVHSQSAASNAKLALMRAGYPDDYPVTLIRAAGVPGEEDTMEMPLYQMDRGYTAPNAHLTSVYVAALPAERRRPSFPRLVEVMAQLRDPENGCPWDLKQTHETLRRYALEEAYEVVEAIDSGDPDKLCDELGDLLLQVVFHAQLASEQGVFEIVDVCEAIVDKLVRRHPHIFGDVKVANADEVLTNWNAIKATEKSNENRKSRLDGIPKALPALMTALEVSKRAVKAGFEWPDVQGIFDKAVEEFGELRHEIENGGSKERIASELGDVLFTLVNVGRQLEIDAEESLRHQLTRFEGRFRFMEERADANGGLESLTLEQMEDLWRQAKDNEQKRMRQERQSGI